MPVTRTTLGLLAASILFGCASEELAAVIIRCADQRDCAAGQMCLAGSCTPVNGGGFAPVTVEVDPQQGSGLVRTELAVIDLSEDAELQLGAPTPYLFSVLNEAAEPVSAHLTLFRTDRLPGAGPSLSVDLLANPRRAQVLDILEGEYDALITPADGARPGIATRFRARSPAGNTETRQFQFRRSRQLYGAVISAVDSQQGLPGVQVYAVSSTTLLRSSVATSTTEGRYAIDLPDVLDRPFRLVARYDSSEARWASEEAINVEPCPGSDPGCAHSDRAKSIALEPTPPDAVRRVGLRFGGVEQGFVAEAGVRVLLTSSTSDALSTRTFRTGGVTGADGYLRLDAAPDDPSVEVLAGLYRVVATPRVGSAYARTSLLLDLRAAGAQVQVPLVKKRGLAGTIYSTVGRPLIQAQLTLTPLEESGAGAIGSTDGGGRFVIAADPAEYLLIVEPGPPTDANESPPVDAFYVDLRGGAGPLDLGLLNVASPVQIAGRVLSPKMEPVGGAELTAFRVVCGRTVELGSTESDAGGAYRLTLGADLSAALPCGDRRP